MGKISQTLGSVDQARILVLEQKGKTTGLQEGEKEELKLLEQKLRRIV